jgi:hypothetical protein
MDNLFSQTVAIRHHEEFLTIYLKKTDIAS